jgi:N-acetylglucosaminyldiphosphoundecaprenol N-acetyl-beta-D-mannosaminyltransferase
LLFGVPIDDLTMDETLEAIDSLVADGRRHGRTHQIATVNVDFLVNALNDQDVRALLQGAALNVADGLPVVWATRLAGTPVRERVTGADLVPAIAADASFRGWRVHFFGSAPGVAERALDLLGQRHPGAELSGTSGPLLSDVSVVDDAVLDEIIGHDPDILCVALGNPKQERFIAAHRERLGIPVMIGIGGSLDMLVGDKKRAPEWAQRVGVEWVFRAAQEPGRLGKRYAKDAVVFGPRVVEYVRALRRHRNRRRLQIDQGPGERLVLTTGDGLGGSIAFADAAERLVGGAGLSIDLRGDMPDPRGICALVGLARIARRSGGDVDVELSSGNRAELSALDLPNWVIDDVDIEQR